MSPRPWQHSVVRSRLQDWIGPLPDAALLITTVTKVSAWAIPTGTNKTTERTISFFMFSTLPSTSMSEVTSPSIGFLHYVLHGTLGGLVPFRLDN